MKALSLYQPWASLVARGIKTIETRTWCPPPGIIGQRIAIHATKRPQRDAMDCHGVAGCMCVYGPPVYAISDGCPVHDLVPYGAVVATALVKAGLPMVTGDYDGDESAYLYIGEPSGNLVIFTRTDPPHEHGYWRNEDVTDQRPFGQFEPGRWAWILGDIRELDRPVPARGRQGLWELTVPLPLVAVV